MTYVPTGRGIEVLTELHHVPRFVSAAAQYRVPSTGATVELPARSVRCGRIVEGLADADPIERARARNRLSGRLAWDDTSVPPELATFVAAMLVDPAVPDRAELAEAWLAMVEEAVVDDGLRVGVEVCGPLLGACARDGDELMALLHELPSAEARLRLRRRVRAEPEDAPFGGDLRERYSAGEHEAVWDELRFLGADVAIVDAIAEETMRRARRGLELLIPRLEAQGLRFGGPDVKPDPRRRPLGVPVQDAAERLAGLERRKGSLPRSVRAFWKVIGSVDLACVLPGQTRSTPPAYFPEPDRGPRRASWPWPDDPALDPLLLLPLEGQEEEPDHVLVTCPETSMGYSGSGGRPLPSSRAADAPLPTWRSATLVEHLRETILRCAGFGGLDPTFEYAGLRAMSHGVPVGELVAELPAF